MVIHGGSGAGYAEGCRCPECTAAHRKRIRLRAHERRDARFIGPDGRLWSPNGTHGTYSTYSNHFCRCLPCSRAQADMMAEWRARRRAS